ncbi:hypothetical protein [Yoonia tamlensis]|nr:hypothetical protein [Yoonia tamlensis]
MEQIFTSNSEQSVEADTGIIRYRDETSLRFRVFVTLVVIPFMVILAIVFISVFGLFGSDALDLIVPILQGDFTRLDDFLGYLVVLLLAVCVPGAFIYASISQGILAPNIVVTFDSNLGIVSVQRELPWFGTSETEYSFNDVEAIELDTRFRTTSEMNEISLRIRGVRRPLVLVAVFSAQHTTQEFQKLKALLGDDGGCRFVTR